MELASLVASVVSVVIGGLAIWLSLHFYTQTKGVETNVQLALEAIKTQTNTLQTLNARTLDRLTKYVTTPREESLQTMELLASTIRELPNIVISLRAPADTSGEAAALRAELLNTQIVLWHYTGLANIYIAGYLPDPDTFVSTDPNHVRLRQNVDRSAGDFHLLHDLILAATPNELRAARYQAHYDDALNRLSILVGDTVEHWTRRGTAAPSS